VGIRLRERSRNPVAGETFGITPGEGEPILYRVLQQRVGHGRSAIPAETQYYVYWAGPAYHNLPRHPLHVIVSFPSASAGPGVSLRSGVRDMYWSELIGGTHLFRTRDHAAAPFRRHAWESQPDAKHKGNTLR